MENIRLGSILLWPNKGPLAWVLARLIKQFDPDPWIRHNWQLWFPYWHMSWVCAGETSYGWTVRQVDGQGVSYPALDELPQTYRVVNWGRPVTQAECDKYRNKYPCKSYDTLGYFWTFLNRVTRGQSPKIVDHNFYCWEDVSYFCDFTQRAWDAQAFDDMPYMPLFIKSLEGVK